jgi:CBS domain-containing protein
MNVRGKNVGDIVRGRPVYFVVEDDTILEAARYMADHQIGAVPVLAAGYKEGILADQVGIISERDLMTRVMAQGLDPATTKISQVMTKQVAVLGEGATSKDALAAMRQLHVRHLPVMIGKQIVGCISMRDLLEAEVETRGAEIDFLDDYIEKMEEVAWS